MKTKINYQLPQQANKLSDNDQTEPEEKYSSINDAKSKLADPTLLPKIKNIGSGEL